MGVRMAGADYRLDYVSEDVAEISFDLGLDLQARLLGVDTGVVKLPGCLFEGIPRLSVCDELGDILSQELKRLIKEPVSLSSPNLLARVERLMGARVGDRVKLVIYRATRQEEDQPDLTGFSRSLPKTPPSVDSRAEPRDGRESPPSLRRRP